MSIINGYDKLDTSMGNDLVGLYYYLLDYSRMNLNNGANKSILGYVPTIQSLSYNPFFDLDTNGINTTKIPFDEDHFGKPSENGKADVYRVTQFPTFNITLNKFNLREVWSKLPSDYETRLLMYPFKYFLLTDYLNPPILLKPELLSPSGEIVVNVTIGLSSISKYNLFVSSYKGDTKGNIEGLTNNNPLQFPVGSTAYASFLATSGNTFAQTNNNALLENDISLRQGTRANKMDMVQTMANGVMGTMASILSGNVTGTISNVVGAGFGVANNNMQNDFLNENYTTKEYFIESMALARKNDLLSTPRTMKTLGNDSKFTMDMGERKVELIEYGLTNQYENKISRYFKRYGYMVNRIGFPVLDSRKYFNFIKFSNCNIYSSKIPKETIKEIENIFESGITIWHVDNGAIVKNYSVENLEVS